MRNIQTTQKLRVLSGKSEAVKMVMMAYPLFEAAKGIKSIAAII